MQTPSLKTATLQVNARWLFAIIVALLGALTANGWLTMASLLLLLLMIRLFWQSGEPPILLYAACYQWLQACILTFQGNIQGVNIDDMGYSLAVVSAAWLSLCGLLAVCIGMRLGAGAGYAKKTWESVAAISAQLSLRRLFFGSLIAIVMAQVLTIAAYIIPGFTQPILALALLHWVIIYLFTYTVFAKRQGFLMLGIVFVIEVAIGFLGFFSGFKTVLIIVFLAMLAAPHALKGVRLKSAVLVGIVILAAAVVWTGIKKEYRTFLNEGTSQQVVLVSVSDRVDKLVELVSALDSDKLQTALTGFVDRLTYVQFFGESIRTVPDHIPYEDGKLWKQAIQVALVPRLLYPEKEVLDDSKRTAYYTANRVAGMEDGASISLGYVAESYIDFGPWLMMPVLLLWGLFVGIAYRILVRKSRYPLFGYACATTVIFLNASVLESSNTKIFAGLVLGFGAMFIVQKYFSKKILRMLALPSSLRQAAA